jgi:hypothetical protein
MLLVLYPETRVHGCINLAKWAVEDGQTVKVHVHPGARSLEKYMKQTMRETWGHKNYELAFKQTEQGFEVSSRIKDVAKWLGLR